MRKITGRLLAVPLMLYLLSACGGNSGDGADTGTPAAVDILRVSGKQIVDSSGNPVYLRGFQGLSAYPIPDDLYLQAVFDKGVDSSQLDLIAADIHLYSLSNLDIQHIKATGANVIRLWTRLYAIKRGPGNFSETALQLLETTINRFGNQGICTVLVMAGAGENNYQPQQPYLDRGINLWDTNSSARTDSIETWSVLAQRFASNPYQEAGCKCSQAWKLFSLAFNRHRLTNSHGIHRAQVFITLLPRNRLAGNPAAADIQPRSQVRVILKCLFPALVGQGNRMGKHCVVQRLC